jgi:hexokinase
MTPIKNFDEAQKSAVDKVIEHFTVSTETLKKISEQFVEEMEKGLDHQGATSNVSTYN